MMKQCFFLLPVSLIAMALLAGCSQSDPTPKPANESAAPVVTTPPANEAVSQPAPSQTEVPAPTAISTSKITSDIAHDLFQQLLDRAKAKSDDVLSGVGSDLGHKAKTLAASLASNAAGQGYLDSTLQSLIGNNPIEALGYYQKLSEAKLTVEQTKLLGEVKNLVSAYIVQDNFSTLEGSKSDVAQIVNSLRKGELVTAVSSLQKVTQNANLTSGQKKLLSALADKFAPGVAGAAKSLTEGLKGLKKLGQ